MRIIIWIFLITCLNCYSQEKITTKPFDRAVNAPKNVTKDCYELSHYLTSPFDNEKEKVEAIIYWITMNISYDFYCVFYDDSRLKKGKIYASRVLLYKKGVCSEYALLFDDLCEYADIECEIITGFAKGYDYTNGKKIDKPNHEWNAVKINNKWELIDLTWATGHVVKQQNDSWKYVKEFNKRYIFDTPEDFILEHFPEDSKWQLINPPISLDKFYSNDFDVKRLKIK